jgi:hypothetical protein
MGPILAPAAPRPTTNAAGEASAGTKNHKHSWKPIAGTRTFTGRSIIKKDIR